MLYDLCYALTHDIRAMLAVPVLFIVGPLVLGAIPHAIRRNRRERGW